MNVPPIEGKIAVVTGAAGVTGRAIVRRFVDDGGAVAMVDISRAGLAELAGTLGDQTLPLTIDISDGAAAEEAIAATVTHFGRVDVLVNNAGILSNNKAVETDAAEWRRIFSVNLDGAFYLSRAVLPHMRARGAGRIINICSLAMKTGGLTAGTAYTASKGALGALTFSLARETATQGITVNGIAPAYVRSPMVTEQLTEEQRTTLLAQIPVRRFCEPEEVAYLVAFLASDNAGFITGEVIDINGGLHLD
jgi:3-oxoacyl-[acyl-carrier protein] reductase